MFFTLVRGAGILLWGSQLCEISTKAEITLMGLRGGLDDLDVTLEAPEGPLNAHYLKDDR